MSAPIAGTDRLADLTKRIGACRVCVDTPSGAPLPHEPRPVLRVSATARLCVCGQAPGTRVHASGIPFDDPSGDRLRDWMGVTRAEFYDESRVAIVPMGFCFPGLDGKGADLPPRKECARTWRAALFDALPRFDLVLLIGYHAQKWHLAGEVRRNLTETVADWRSFAGRDATPRYLPLPHPSWRNSGWLKRNPWFGEEVVPYLRAEVR
ncbi:MAG: uracil-DNA glycosylase family protein, partial [Dichotomicrobium sp.]